eukprot:471529-Lingulodinium_polyedra.AAC.1
MLMAKRYSRADTDARSTAAAWCSAGELPRNDKKFSIWRFVASLVRLTSRFMFRYSEASAKAWPSVDEKASRKQGMPDASLPGTASPLKTPCKTSTPHSALAATKESKKPRRLRPSLFAG